MSLDGREIFDDFFDRTRVASYYNKIYFQPLQAVCALRSLSIMGGIQNLIICVKMAWSEHLDCGGNIR